MLCPEKSFCIPKKVFCVSPKKFVYPKKVCCIPIFFSNYLLRVVRFDLVRDFAERHDSSVDLHVRDFEVQCFCELGELG